MASDWTPFRDGRWAEIAPWGRTWIDNAPWGFAPAHYGRWARGKRPLGLGSGQRGRKPSPSLSSAPQDRETATALRTGSRSDPSSRSTASAPVIVNNVRVISPPVVPKSRQQHDRQQHHQRDRPGAADDADAPAIGRTSARRSRTRPATSPPATEQRPRNLSGLGAAGAPMQTGVSCSLEGRPLGDLGFAAP